MRGGVVGGGKLDPKRWSNVVFAALFALALLLFGRIVWPFLMPVLLGGFLVVLFLPLRDLIARRLRLSAPLAAAVSTLAVFLLICVPIVVTGFFVARELLGMADAARDLLERNDLRTLVADRLPGGLRRYVQSAPGGPTDDALASALSRGVDMLSGVLAAGTGIAINLFLVIVAMYYFFLDGRRLVRTAAGLLPLDRRYFDAFVQEFKDVTWAIVYGNTLTALIQGAIGFIGLSMAGVPHAAVWAAAMAVVAMIPIGGTALVWGPLSLVLFAQGRTTDGLIVLGWGALVVSTIDNLIRPRLCGTRMALHPLLVFISMFGGLAVFGMMGLVVGPLISALFMSMVRIWRRDFLPALMKEGPGPEPEPTPEPDPDPPPQPEPTPVVH